MRKLLCTGLPMYLSVGVRIGVSAAGVSIGVSLRFFFYFSISSFPQNSFALPFLAGVALVILLASANISMCERRQHQHASSPCLCSAYVCVCVHRCVCVADFYWRLSMCLWGRVGGWVLCKVPTVSLKSLDPNGWGAGAKMARTAEESPVCRSITIWLNGALLKLLGTLSHFCIIPPDDPRGAIGLIEWKCVCFWCTRTFIPLRKSGSLNMNITTTKVKQVKECRNSPVDTTITWKLVRKVSM